MAIELIYSRTISYCCFKSSFRPVFEPPTFEQKSVSTSTSTAESDVVERLDVIKNFPLKLNDFASQKIFCKQLGWKLLSRKSNHKVRSHLSLFNLNEKTKNRENVFLKLILDYWTLGGSYLVANRKVKCSNPRWLIILP